MLHLLREREPDLSGFEGCKKKQVNGLYGISRQTRKNQHTNSGAPRVAAAAFTDEQLEYIRKKYCDDGVVVRKIAEEFDVSYRKMYYLIKSQGWLRTVAKCPISKEDRKKALELRKMNQTQEAIAKALGVNVSTLVDHIPEMRKSKPAIGSNANRKRKKKSRGRKIEVKPDHPWAHTPAVVRDRNV